MSAIIGTKNLSKTYTQGQSTINAVRNINISIEKGHIIAIIGPSGAGKSTLLHMLGSLEKPSNGSVSFLGKDLYSLSDIERSSLRNSKAGFIFQFFNLLGDFTVLENVMLPALMNKNGLTGKDASVRAARLLDRMGMGNRLKHRPGELSGGEAQRAAIARALINDPEVIFCDEPTGNLDSAMSGQIYDIIYYMVKERNMTAVVVTHHLADKNHFDRVYEMRDGGIDKIITSDK